MNEHGYIRAVHRRLPQEIYRWKICDSFNNEVIDAMYHWEGVRTLWVEYKYRKDLPKRGATIVRPALTVKQKSWLDERSARGLPCAVVVGSPIGGAIYTPNEWSTGITCDAFKKRAVGYAKVCAWIKSALQEGWSHEQPHDHLPGS